MKKTISILLLCSVNSIAIGQLSSDSVRNERVYDSLVILSDSLFNLGQYPEAKKKILEAGAISPTQYVIERIKEINKILEYTPGCGGGEYQKIVDKANELYESKEYYGAQKLYKRALVLNPANPQSDIFKDRINEITKIIEVNKE